MANRVDAGKLALNRGRRLIPFPHRGTSNRADAEYPGTPNNEGRIGEPSALASQTRRST
jgi:hypothetical protein